MFNIESPTTTTAAPSPRAAPAIPAEQALSSSPSSSHPPSPIPHPPSHPLLPRLKTVSIERLLKVLEDPDSSHREARLAASVALAYCTSAERLAAAPKRSDPRADGRSSPEDDINPPGTPDEWANTIPDDEIETDAFGTRLGPTPDHIIRNHHVHELQRLAYDSGYWTGWNKSPREDEGPPYVPACVTPERRTLTPRNPLALVRNSPARLTISAAGANARGGTGGSDTPKGATSSPPALASSPGPPAHQPMRPVRLKPGIQSETSPAQPIARPEISPLATDAVARANPRPVIFIPRPPDHDRAHPNPRAPPITREGE